MDIISFGLCVIFVSPYPYSLLCHFLFLLFFFSVFLVSHCGSRCRLLNLSPWLTSHKPLSTANPHVCVCRLACTECQEHIHILTGRTVRPMCEVQMGPLYYYDIRARCTNTNTHAQGPMHKYRAHDLVLSVC